VVILPVRNCPCDPAYSWRATKKPRDFPSKWLLAELAPAKTNCQSSYQSRSGLLALISETSTLATQRMHCDYQLWMHLLTLSPYPPPSDWPASTDSEIIQCTVGRQANVSCHPFRRYSTFISSSKAYCSARACAWT
jgi:hypothetical protein